MTLVGKAAIKPTVASGKPIGIQFKPLSVERERPPLIVPAYRFVPIADSVRTDKFDKPLFAVTQDAPSSDDRNTPLPSVPTNNSESRTAKARILPDINP
jgi:hypothetical protein